MAIVAWRCRCSHENPIARPHCAVCGTPVVTTGNRPIYDAATQQKQQETRTLWLLGGGALAVVFAGLAIYGSATELPPAAWSDVSPNRPALYSSPAPNYGLSAHRGYSYHYRHSGSHRAPDGVPKTEYVHEHTRRNGTHVRSYFRRPARR